VKLTSKGKNCFTLRVETGSGKTNVLPIELYRGADKSLARPGRKQATATEDFADKSLARSGRKQATATENFADKSLARSGRKQDTATEDFADKSLARSGRKQATATEDFYFHVPYL
jgi:hypothetical protein